jgi:hypothetical protein
MAVVPPAVRKYLSEIGKRGYAKRTKNMTDEERSAIGRAGGLAGGKKGGEERAKALTPKRRKEIASEAAKARWAKKKATPA